MHSSLPWSDHTVFFLVFTFRPRGRHRAASLSTLNFSPVNSRWEARVAAKATATSRAGRKFQTRSASPRVTKPAAVEGSDRWPNLNEKMKLASCGAIVAAMVRKRRRSRTFCQKHAMLSAALHARVKENNYSTLQQTRKAREHVAAGGRQSTVKRPRGCFFANRR